MKFVPIGVGDAFTERSYGSSMVVMGAGKRLLIDFPDPPRRALREASLRSGLDLRVETIDAAYLTHLHGDHVNGLEAMTFYRYFREHRKLRLAAAPAVLGELWGRLRPSMDRLVLGDRLPRRMSLADYYDLVPVPEGRRTRIGPFTLEVRRTHHHVPTFAVRVTCGGRTLAFSSDTSYDPGLIEWLSKGAHAIVHETNVGIHTPYERLAALPASIRSRMRLIHYPDDLPRRRPAIPCLRVGQVYTV
ncbi:MAG: MBL fold metallo-hydrolase [Planctomycetota bacterium]